MVRRRVLVSGRVQGVWFRQTCRRLAEERGLGGFVRNLADGRVEACFEGDPAAVEEMVAWCRMGPPGAQVSGVEVFPEEPVGESSFGIR